MFADLLSAIREAVREFKRRRWLRHRRAELMRDPTSPF
jgi:hypothetical protein